MSGYDVEITLGGQAYTIPLTIGLIFDIEREHGSVLKILKDIQAAEYTASQSVQTIKTVFKCFDIDISTDQIKASLFENGLAELNAALIAVIAPLVTGVNMIASLDNGEGHRLGKP